MAGFVRDDLPETEVQRQRDLSEPFTQALRELVDAGLRTLVDDDEIRAAQAEGRAIAAEEAAKAAAEEANAPAEEAATEDAPAEEAAAEEATEDKGE